MLGGDILVGTSIPKDIFDQRGIFGNELRQAAQTRLQQRDLTNPEVTPSLVVSMRLVNIRRIYNM